MPEHPPVPDQDSRERIATDLGRTLFVEAGAGSGKTSALVARVVALVRTGVAELANIAAITFTDKAAADLRDRVRRALEDAAATDPSGDAAGRCRSAVEALDGAAFGTLHSFARRILSEHPVEAGLPPRIEVLDEVASGVEFERRWGTFLDTLLADASLERTILALLACGVKAAALRQLAQAFDDNWDLVDERVPETAAEPPSAHAMLAPALAGIDQVIAWQGACREPGDKLYGRLDEIARYVQRLRSFDDEVELLEALASSNRPTFKVGNHGKKENWDLDLSQFRAQVSAAAGPLSDLASEVSGACARRLACAIRGFTLGAANERRAAGRLEFHDLLVLARRLLRDPVHGPAVRAQLHARYQRVLLDEFQDTDPIQIELAVRIAAAAPCEESSGSKPWPEVAVAPGHLFVVGDPKQSIYRFRRADIEVYLLAQRCFALEGAGAVELSTNFRTNAGVIGWVNQVFASLMAESPGSDAPSTPRPEYRPLSTVRDLPPVGAAVSVLGRNAHPAGTTAAEVRAAEAAQVAAVVANAIHEGWSVGDRYSPRGWRPARFSDVAVLVPARTSLPFLEDAFDRASIAFRTESGSLVYATRAVRDLLMVLRAISDPSDHLRIVSALRTPLMGCGDDDLFRFKVQCQGRWSFLDTQPDTVPFDNPVRSGLAYFRSIYDQRYWKAPSELLDQVARDRRAFELGFSDRRARDVWRRLRFVIDQARSWSEATGGNLRQYLTWVERQSGEGVRVTESVLPETDDDAVRIMTIHGAKGLEFPITIVSGMSSAPGGARASVQVVFPPAGPPGYRFGTAVKTQEFTGRLSVEEQMDRDERIRLLYVACTRARDHLVVSLHRVIHKSVPNLDRRTGAEALVAGMGALLDQVPDGVGPDAAPAAPAGAVPLPLQPLPPMKEWSAERELILSRSARPTAVAATALTEEGGPDWGVDVGRPPPDPTAAPDATSAPDPTAAPDPAATAGPAATAAPDPGLQKRPRDLDLPPWLKGRYGTGVGRAVHGVLQTVDLATGAGTEAAAAAQCEAEAIPGRTDDVVRLVRHALGSPSVIEAARCPHWRELYACIPIDGRLLEGYVDLLYRGPDGLVVLDYKTSASSDPGDSSRRVRAYRLQGASYALAVGAAAGEPVIRVTFVFLTALAAFERDLPDLDAAVADVRALVQAGHELTTN